MKTLVKLALLGTAFASFAASAFAADSPLVIIDPPVIEVNDVFNWSGFYVGVQVGVIAVDTRVDDVYNFRTDVYGNGNNRYYNEPDYTGYYGGIHLGASQQFDQVVVGVVTDLNKHGGEGEANYYYDDFLTGDLHQGPNDDEYSSFAMHWDGSARIKLGVALDRLLPYITGGLAYGQANYSEHREFDDGPHDFSGVANLLGYTVGVGLSYAITDNVIVTGEYRFTDFGDLRLSPSDGSGDSSSLQVDTSNHRAELGLSFLFN